MSIHTVCLYNIVEGEVLSVIVMGNSAMLVLFLLALPPPRKTRAELMKAIDFEYYGYLDEDDGVIVPLEQEYEKKRRSIGISFHCRWCLVSLLSFENMFLNSASCQKGVLLVADGLQRKWSANNLTPSN